MGPPRRGRGRRGPRLLAGEKVPDPIVEALVVPRLGPGFVLDGYPRSVTQAARLDAILEREGHPLDAALELELDDEILVVRMVLRSGAEKRSDDRPDVFLRRLETYRREAAELRDFYDGRLVRVDGSGEPSEIYERIRSALG